MSKNLNTNAKRVSKSPRVKKKTKPHDGLDDSGFPKPTELSAAAIPPSRAHGASYHYPLLMSQLETCDPLLKWFDSVEDERCMPWRRDWIDPERFDGSDDELQEALAKRAYEVWVSEIMLQQTRVQTVIPYYNHWLSRWPTIQSLSEASHDDVLSVWKGLGYYSRATRLHQGAQAVIAQSQSSTSAESKICPIPDSPEKLQNIPGIGRYTAGAISSIAFGNAAAVVDGNVCRVLSRQLGLWVDVKERAHVERLWSVAEGLVRHVSSNDPQGETGTWEEKKSAIPGKWNQALMELGSTVCVPLKPKCGECPIRASCRAYAEGEALMEKDATRTHIFAPLEDACSYCGDIDIEDIEVANEDDGDSSASPPRKRRKREKEPRAAISKYFTSHKCDGIADSISGGLVQEASGPRSSCSACSRSISIRNYCSLFPKKVSKKPRTEKEGIICIIELRCTGKAGSSEYLIEKRPANGLLASLWQFPLIDITGSQPSSTKSHQSSAEQCLSSLGIKPSNTSTVQHTAELGTIVHLLTHIKLTMHVHSLVVVADDKERVSIMEDEVLQRKWVVREAVENETLSTGMRKCWKLYKNSPKQNLNPE
ncbi:DNA glycosylase [Delitschia confertaspora ATCC 74209]|uniref:Adenine DNA glycosylase n=1 Tax=Delitschia confertaspora ATCC 74209 TaxID=1513339 RepID=A0A9P4JUE3_9PLEO|nr:DNA glycosylase [Delitschia confertaspora ATCC 74209]